MRIQIDQSETALIRPWHVTGLYMFIQLSSLYNTVTCTHMDMQLTGSASCVSVRVIGRVSPQLVSRIVKSARDPRLLEQCCCRLNSSEMLTLCCWRRNFTTFRKFVVPSCSGTAFLRNVGNYDSQQHGITSQKIFFMEWVAMKWVRRVARVEVNCYGFSFRNTERKSLIERRETEGVPA